MVRMLRKLAQHTARVAFLKTYCGELTIGEGCHIPFRNLRATVKKLKIGNNVRFGDRVVLGGDSFSFGDFFWCGNDVSITGGGARLEVGKFGAVASRVTLLLGKGRHRPQSLSSFPFGHFPPFDSPDWTSHFDYETESQSFCTMGHDVWIGEGSLILPNVAIGSGAIVAAGAVVREDVPDYAIVSGNPAQVVAFRFKPSLIQELLELKWWDWPAEKINHNTAFFTKNLTGRTSLSGLKIIE